VSIQTVRLWFASEGGPECLAALTRIACIRPTGFQAWHAPAKVHWGMGRENNGWAMRLTGIAVATPIKAADEGETRKLRITQHARTPPAKTSYAFDGQICAMRKIA
jgi:hypothetical protein